MHDKNKDKNVRIPIEGEANQNPKAIRPSLSRNMKLDSSFYEAEAPDMTHMKINDLDDAVQWWIDRGAVPVERKSEKRRIYKGLSNKGDSEYVTWNGGVDDGTPYRVWLLRIDPEKYNYYKTAPQEVRQKDIRDSMYRNIGKDPTGGTDNVTYAPHLPVGDGVGFNELKSG